MNSLDHGNIFYYSKKIILSLGFKVWIVRHTDYKTWSHAFLQNFTVYVRRYDT